MTLPYLIGEGMTGGYGPADILHDCTVAVEKGQIAVIVGPNGAGKSTAMKAVFGMLRLRRGRVVLDGRDITLLSPQDRVAEGMAFVPQTSNVFTSMTVEENLEMGAFLRRDDIRPTMEQVYHLFPVLSDARDRFQAHMKERGIETLIHYPVPITRQPALRSASPAMCAVADRVCAQVVSLPMYPGLSDQAVAAVAEAAATFTR